MHRLTVTLSERRHRALEEASARRGKTMSQLNDESLDAYGIKSSAAAEHLVARARGRSELKQARHWRWPSCTCRQNVIGAQGEEGSHKARC